MIVTETVLDPPFRVKTETLQLAVQITRVYQDGLVGQSKQAAAVNELNM